MIVSESIIKSPSHDRQFLFEENEKIKKFLYSIQDEINNTYSEGPDMKKILNNHGIFHHNLCFYWFFLMIFL